MPSCPIDLLISVDKVIHKFFHNLPYRCISNPPAATSCVWGICEL